MEADPPTELRFGLDFEGTVPIADATQVFNFSIALLGDDEHTLDTLPVQVVVPGVYSDADFDGVEWYDDCDDTDAEVGATSEDFDCDGAIRDEDCDDRDPDSTIVADDADCDGVPTTEDCDDSTPLWGSITEDADCDGFATEDDCDDTDPAATTLDSDADCDGVETSLDCDDTDPTTVDDMDCDGWTIDDDCDDENPEIFPGAPEACNGTDDNCDGSIDEGLEENTYFLDADGDGYGMPESTTTACDLPEGYSEVFSDCDDSMDDTFPGAYEFCDDRDNDCNSLIDDDCGSRRDYVMFVTSTFIESSEDSWLDNREDADGYCADYAADQGIEGSDFRIVYSTPEEDARDHLDYMPGLDRVYDRDGTEVGGEDIFDGSSLLLPDMTGWTITGTGIDGAFSECSGSYESGSWPICQYCDRKFTCSGPGEGLLTGESCCWTGTRSIVCMGAL